MDADGNKRDVHVDRDEKRRESGEKAKDEQDASREFSPRRDLPQPMMHVERRHIMDELEQCAVRNHLLVAVDGHRYPSASRIRRTPQGWSLLRKRIIDGHSLSKLDYGDTPD